MHLCPHKCFIVVQTMFHKTVVYVFLVSFFTTTTAMIVDHKLIYITILSERTLHGISPKKNISIFKRAALHWQIKNSGD